MARPVASYQHKRWQLVVPIVLSLLEITFAVEERTATLETPSFGVDVSFPMQHAQVTDLERPFGDSVMPFYDKFLQGCRMYYKERSEKCEESEHSRLNLNAQQPRAMQNYTSAGYAKVQVPSQTMKLLKDFWNSNQGKEMMEQWPAGNTYVNHWETPTFMLPLANPKLKGGGNELENSLLDAVQPTLEAWTGQSLIFTSLYGVRVYKEGAVLTPHIDRLPLVSSAIINVAQDVDEPWPLEVIGHDGKAHNVTMVPGDLLLYESHSIIHGRPFPLRGKYYANVFLHFEPHGHTERHQEKEAHHSTTKQTAKDRYVNALKQSSPPRPKLELPDYIQAGTEEEEKWRQQYVFQAVSKKKVKIIADKPFIKSQAHSAASKGDLVTLKQLAKKDAKALHEKDRNGWLPLHEAARAGESEAVEYLIKEGADVNERTNDGTGGTPLWWAQQLFDDDHPAVRVLQRFGGVNIGPEFED